MSNDYIISAEEVLSHLSFGQRLIGLDLGTKTIGLGLSNPDLTVATPLETIRRKKFQQDTDLLLSICAEWNVGALVLGLPFNMDGTEGPRAQSTRSFARNLHQKTDLPMLFWDERLSTVAVTRTLLDLDTSRAKRADVVDKMAASFILQGVLDRLAHLAHPPETD
ncbi:Holliday junction resolvase RuvX [Coralliovum pocilloporae]|uniref:Holliday junction resolvase RuvX n=1 Tax=Coralliovum pocilloporae TaxID=3066369 RepID=UPI0033078699